MFIDPQGIGRDVPRSQHGPPMGNPLKKRPISRGHWVKKSQESLENTS